MAKESRSGPRTGTPLSHLKWVAKKGALARTYEGSFNEVIVRAFARPRKPIDVLDDLVKAFKARNQSTTKQDPRDYVSMRLYELKRHDFFIIKEG